jgi:predicted nucleic acid-binding protein
MRVFLDANILVSVLNKEYPYYLYTSRILSMTEEKRATLVTTNVCLAIAYYFAEKKHGQILAKNKILLLLEHIDIADCGKREALSAAQNKKVHDFEDGLQYYAAVHANCNFIVTNDLEDFYFSEVQVIEPERFFRKYVQQYTH